MTDLVKKLEEAVEAGASAAALAPLTAQLVLELAKKAAPTKKTKTSRR